MIQTTTTTMIAQKRSHFPSFTPFRSSKNRSSLPNNFDLIARSFDADLLRRLKPLTPRASTTAFNNFSLSWLSQAVDFLSATHAEAHALIAKLDVKMSPSYLDGSLSILDACNSISREIQRLRQRRLLINSVLQLLQFPGHDGCRLPAPEKLRRARDLLSSDQDKNKPLTKQRALIDSEASVRNLALPRGKISSAEEVVRRTMCAVGVITAFLARAAVATLSGEDAAATAAIGIPAEFAWAKPLGEIGSVIGVPAEVGDVEESVRALRNVIDGVVVEGFKVEGNAVKELWDAVKEVEAAMGKFSDGLERLADGVNRTFGAVLGSRNGMLVEYRKGHESCDEKQSNSNSKCKANV